MGPFLELLLLVLLVQADDKHICPKKELHDYRRTTEIPMKRSDAENCVDPSSCTRRIQRNGLRWIEVPRCCRGYKPIPHLKELVCVSACPQGCPEFAKCRTNGTCVCKEGLEMVSRTPLVCISTPSSGETLESSPSTDLPPSTSPSTDLPPSTSPSLSPSTADVTWSTDEVKMVDSEFSINVPRELEEIRMSSAASTTARGLFVVWMIFLLRVVAG